MNTADTTAPAAPLPSPAAALCLPSTWPMLAPALLQRRLPLDAGPDLVHQWLSDGMARVGAPARDALRLMACQTWRLQALPPDHQQHAGLDGWQLQVGDKRWTLWCLPAPHTRLVAMQQLA